MSKPFLGLGSLRIWSEQELEDRDFIQKRLVFLIQNKLKSMNAAWSFFRIEGPVLILRSNINPNYSDKDIFITNHEKVSESLCLRPETTFSSYLEAKYFLSSGYKLPLCVWQSGKSFRRELNDGANASSLRFNEFTQLEFQCVFSKTSKADYRNEVLGLVRAELEKLICTKCTIVESDRLPSYSKSTLDINAIWKGNEKEVASVSLREDFDENNTVLEFAFGLDRLVEIRNQ